MGDRQGPFTFFAGATNPMLLVDDDLRIVNANESACRLLRYEAAALASMRLSDLVDLVDLVSLTASWRELETTGSFVRSLRMLSSDGRFINTGVNATASIRPGHHLLIFVVDPGKVAGRGSNHRGSQDGDVLRVGSSGNPLTTREAEVLGLIARGLRANDIAVELGIASNTVNAHTSSAMRKLKSSTRAQAAAAAAVRGWISIET